MSTNMKKSWMKRTLVLVTLGATALLGCELVVDFDRTRIPVEDAGTTGDAAPTVDAAPTADAADEDASDASDAGDAADAPDDVVDAADQ